MSSFVPEIAHAVGIIVLVFSSYFGHERWSFDDGSCLSMKIRRALLGFFAITFFYVVALIWLDSENKVLSETPRLVNILPILFGFSLLSYFIRYLRCSWFLARAGYKVPFVYGFLAYLSGFAFTATLGKFGELIRVRYLASKGVPAWRVL